MSSYIPGVVCQGSLPQPFSVEYRPDGVNQITVTSGRIWSGENNLIGSSSGVAACFFIDSNTVSNWLRLGFSNGTSRNLPDNAEITALTIFYDHRVNSASSLSNHQFYQARFFRDDFNITETTRFIGDTVPSGTNAWQNNRSIASVSPSVWGMNSSQFLSSWNSPQGMDFEFNARAQSGLNTNYEIRDIRLRIDYLA